jgi:hypothetical protein
VEHLGFGSLWLQVIVATVATFVASSICWMFMPWHRTEFKALPNEDAVRKVLHEQGVTEGQWRIPFSPRREEWKTPEFQERFKTGPVGIFQLERPRGMAMGPRLLKSFLYFFVICFFTAYVLRHAVLSGQEFWLVFQVGGAVSFGAHALGHVQDAIWFGKSWRRVGFQALDAVIYSLITGFVFAQMWPWA